MNYLNQSFVKILPEIKLYFSSSESKDIRDNRNSVVHGYIHSRFWDKNSFERIIFDIVRLSKVVRF